MILSNDISSVNDSIDEFCRGKFFLVQPKKYAHKSGLDAMLLSSAVPSGFCGKVADFGSGAGAAALAVLTRCPKSNAYLVENSKIMLEYATKTLNLKANSHLAKRAVVIEADVTKKGSEREASQLAANQFDFIIMNPPYNNSSSNQSIYGLRALAHVKTSNLFELWLRTAACCLKAKGKIAIIAKAYSIHEILNACHKRFGAINIYPIYPHEKADNLRLLFVAQKNARGPTIIKPPLYIRHKTPNGSLDLTPQIVRLSNAISSIYEEE